MAIGKQGRLADGAIGVALESQQVVAVASSMRCTMDTELVTAVFSFVLNNELLMC